MTKPFRVTEENAFAVMLRTTMAAAQMSVTRFADAVGVTPATAREWLRVDGAGRRPRVDMLPKIAAVFCVHVKDLFYDNQRIGELNQLLADEPLRKQTIANDYSHARAMLALDKLARS